MSSLWGGKGKDKQVSAPSARAASPNSRGNVPASTAIESTIGANTHIKGDIQGDGGLRIDGVVEGTIELTGNLVVTESAKLKAEIKASNISIAGAVQGNVSANRVEILDTGRVWGDLTIKSLLINEGAYFHGKTFMPKDVQPPQIEATKPSLSALPPATPSSAAPQAGSVVDVDAPSKKK